MGKQEILKQDIYRFVKSTDEEFDYFLSHSKERSNQKNQVVISAGDRMKN